MPVLFSACLAHCLCPPAALQSLDVHGTGTIDYQEFLAATVHTGRLCSEEHLHAAFDDLDEDGSGCVCGSISMQSGRGGSRLVL